MEPYVALTLLSSLLFASGNVMQKSGIPPGTASLSIARLVGRPLGFFAALARSPLWLLGLVVTLLAMAVETQALGNGDVSVVKPLSRIQSVFVLLIGVVLLRERLGRLEWLGVAALIGGGVALGLEPSDAVLYAPTTRTNWTAAAVVAGLGALLVVSCDRRLVPLRAELGLALAAGALFGLSDVMLKAATEVARGPVAHFDLLHSDTLHGLVTTSEFYLGFGATAAAFLLQQAAFARGRVSVVVPLIGMAGTALAVLLGVSLMREPLGGQRILAVAVMVTGTALLAGRDAG